MTETLLELSPWEISESDFPAQGEPRDRLLFLLRYATLAPSSHNTQPWAFEVGDDRIEMYADLDRWLRVADVDRRELHLSLGCALENLLLAAEHFGFRHQVVLFPDPRRPTWAATIRLFAGGMIDRRTDLFTSIPKRRTHHGHFDGSPLAADLLARLVMAGTEVGVRVASTTDRDTIREVAELVALADRIEYADADFREELGATIDSGAFGTPEPFRTIAAQAVRTLDLGKRMAKKDASLVRSAGALLLIVSKADDAKSQLRAGRVLERVWLLATSLGLALQPMSAPIQLRAQRAELARIMGIEDERPQHLFRIGHAEQSKRHKPRRALEEMILD